MHRTIKFGFFALAGLAIFIAGTFNLQPWFAIGQDAAQFIDVVPLLGWLSEWVLSLQSARIVGGIAAFLGFCLIRNSDPKWVPGFLLLLVGLTLLGAGLPMIAHLGYVIGFVAWAWVQLVQISPIMVEFLGDRAPRWQEHLKQYRVAAYAVETAVMLFRFPPYVGGAVAFWNDLGYGLDETKLDWANFGRMALGMLLFEFVVGFLCNAYAGLNEAYGPSKQALVTPPPKNDGTAKAH